MRIWSRPWHLRLFSGLFVLALASCGDGGGITITPGVAGIQFVLQPTDVVPGATFSVSVELVDSDDGRVTDADDEVTLSVSGNATLNGIVEVNAVNGLATFDGLSIPDPASGIRLTASTQRHTAQSETFSVLEICEILAGTLVAGQSRSGSLDQDDCLISDIVDGLPSSFADRWGLELTSETSVEIDLSSSGFDAFLFVMDSQGSLVGFNDSRGDGSTNARVAQTFAAGEYVVLATSNFPGETGAYQIEYREVGPCEAVEFFLFLGNSRSGGLTDGDCVDVPGRLLDFWYLSMTEAAIFDVTLEASAFDPLVGSEVQGGGHQLSGGAGVGTVTVEHMYPVGDYWLFATSMEVTPGTPPTGSYTLETSVARAEAQVGCPNDNPTAVVGGSAGTANISADDCQTGDAVPRPFDVYSFYLLAGESMEALVSADFEAQFQLQFGAEIVESLRNVPAGTPRTLEVTAEDAGFYSVFIVPEDESDTGEYDVSFSGGATTAPPGAAAPAGTLSGSVQQHLSDNWERE